MLPALSTGQYVFPIAPLLASMDATAARSVVSDLALGAGGELGEGELAADGLTAVVEAAISDLDKRKATVALRRLSAPVSSRATLEALGREWGVTRERVRQLEMKARRRLGRAAVPLATGLCRFIMHRRGSLLVDQGGKVARLVCFAARAIGVPVSILRGCDRLLVGAELPALWTTVRRHFPECIDSDLVCSRIEDEWHPPLGREDIRVIAGSLQKALSRSLNKTQRVYLALRQLGRPAHYSEVAQAYNTMFPDDPSSEHNVHAVLGYEKCGVVWIGVKGTYALKEWGYDRPESGLYNQVAEIVKRKHAETGAPVPFQVILAEIGRYRRVVRQSSVSMAAYLNPALHPVTSDSFVPRSEEAASSDLSLDQLDLALREFEMHARREKAGASSSSVPELTVKPNGRRPDTSAGRPSKRGAEVARTPQGLLTPHAAFVRPILKVLVELGGSASRQAVSDRVGKLMANTLTSADREPLKSGEPRWRNRAAWVRFLLAKEGLLSATSERGVWEITPAGRRWLAEGKEIPYSIPGWRKVQQR
jgi:hypothetical protein